MAKLAALLADRDVDTAEATASLARREQLATTTVRPSLYSAPPPPSVSATPWRGGGATGESGAVPSQGGFGAPIPLAELEPRAAAGAAISTPSGGGQEATVDAGAADEGGAVRDKGASCPTVDEAQLSRRPKRNVRGTCKIRER